MNSCSKYELQADRIICKGEHKVVSAVDVADLVALDVPALSCDNHVGELLLPKQPAEHSQQVVLVVVPLEAVLLPGGGHSSRPSHRLNHLASRVTTEGPLSAARAESEKAARKSRRNGQMST